MLTHSCWNKRFFFHKFYALALIGTIVRRFRPPIFGGALKANITLDAIRQLKTFFSPLRGRVTFLSILGPAKESVGEPMSSKGQGKGSEGKPEGSRASWKGLRGN